MTYESMQATSERLNRRRTVATRTRFIVLDKGLFIVGLLMIALAIALTWNVGQVYQRGVNDGYSQGAMQAQVDAYEKGYASAKYDLGK